MAVTTSARRTSSSRDYPRRHRLYSTTRRRISEEHDGALSFPSTISLPQRQSRHGSTLLRFMFQSNLQRRQRHNRGNRNRRRFSYRKALAMGWALMGLWSYGILGWLFWSVDDNIRLENGFSSPVNQEIQHEIDVSSTSTLPMLMKNSSPATIAQAATLSSKHLLVQEEQETMEPGISGSNDGNMEHSRKFKQNPSPKRPHSLTKVDLVKEWAARQRLADEGFGWIALPSCLLLLLLSVHRVWEEHQKNQRQHRRREQYRQRRNGGLRGPFRGTATTDAVGMSLASDNSNDDRMASILETLELINQDRLERGEPMVSLDSYLAFQRVLSDRSIWIGLADTFDHNERRERRQREHTSRGMRPEELEAACPLWTYEETMADLVEECSICLSQYETNDAMRTLPCDHAFHKDCIDQWMERSTFCPMCKLSLQAQQDVSQN